MELMIVGKHSMEGVEMRNGLKQFQQLPLFSKQLKSQHVGRDSLPGVGEL